MVGEAQSNFDPLMNMRVTTKPNASRGADSRTLKVVRCASFGLMQRLGSPLHLLWDISISQSPPFPPNARFPRACQFSRPVHHYHPAGPTTSMTLEAKRAKMAEMVAITEGVVIHLALHSSK